MKDMLLTDDFKNELVLILTRDSFINVATGKYENYSQTVYFKDCDGLFIYYSFSPGKKSEISGCIPVTAVLDVIKASHAKTIMEEEGEDGTEEEDSGQLA